VLECPAGPQGSWFDGSSNGKFWQTLPAKSPLIQEIYDGLVSNSKQQDTFGEPNAKQLLENNIDKRPTGDGRQSLRAVV
jgi:hypothetical protein